MISFSLNIVYSRVPFSPNQDFNLPINQPTNLLFACFCMVNRISSEYSSGKMPRLASRAMRCSQQRSHRYFIKSIFSMVIPSTSPHAKPSIHHVNMFCMFMRTDSKAGLILAEGNVACRWLIRSPNKILLRHRSVEALE